VSLSAYFTCEKRAPWIGKYKPFTYTEHMTIWITFMSRVGFESGIPVFQLFKTVHGLDSAVTVIGGRKNWKYYI
jgi:hypothetical protein